MDQQEKNRQVGARIKLAREAKGLSQDELAEILSVKQGTVARWEQGSFPKRIGLPPIAKALDKTVEWLLGDESESKPAPLVPMEIEARLAALEKLAYPAMAEDAQALRLENAALRARIEKLLSPKTPEECITPDGYEVIKKSILDEVEKALGDDVYSPAERWFISRIRKINQRELRTVAEMVDKLSGGEDRAIGGRPKR